MFFFFFGFLLGGGGAISHKSILSANKNSLLSCTWHSLIEGSGLSLNFDEITLSCFGGVIAPEGGMGNKWFKAGLYYAPPYNAI